MNMGSFFREAVIFACPSARAAGKAYYFAAPDQGGQTSHPRDGLSIQMVMDRVGRDIFSRYPAYQVWLKIGHDHFYFDEKDRLDGTHTMRRPEWFPISENMCNVTAHQLLDLWNKDLDNALTALAAHMGTKDYLALDRFIQANSRLVP